MCGSYVHLCVCVCVCACARTHHVCWVDTLGISPWRFSSSGVCESLLPSPPLPYFLLGDCALNKFFCPRWSLRILLSLNFGEKCFLGAVGVIGVIMDLFKTKQSQDIGKIFKKKKRKTRTEMMKSFENFFVTYLIFKKNLQYQPHKLLTLSWGGR